MSSGSIYSFLFLAVAMAASFMMFASSAPFIPRHLFAISSKSTFGLNFLPFAWTPKIFFLPARSAKGT
jgi:hypothetical protein